MRLIRPMLLALAAASLFAGSSPAFAQRTGSHIGKNARPKDVGKIVEMVADCVVDRRPKVVLAWLDHLPGTEAEFRYVLQHEVDLDPCLGNDKLVVSGEVVFEPKALRSPIAQAYARKSLKTLAAAPGGLSPESAPWFLARFEALPEGTAVDTPALVIQDFGHCVASSNWPAASAFLLSSARSDEERAAVNALKPSLGACLSKDSTVALTTQNLRVALAEPMVHLMMAPVQEAAK